MAHPSILERFAYLRHGDVALADLELVPLAGQIEQTLSRDARQNQSLTQRRRYQLWLCTPLLNVV